MSISLFIERHDESGRQEIDLAEWQQIAMTDADLRLWSGPLRIRNPQSGEVISIPVGPGASELRLQGEWTPFLVWQGGALTCQYREEMEDPDNPVRLKIVELLQTLRASIFVDVQDEPLEW